MSSLLGYFLVQLLWRNYIRRKRGALLRAVSALKTS
jgi:hypothetical protein